MAYLLLGAGVGAVGGFAFAQKYFEAQTDDPANKFHPRLLTGFPSDDVEVEGPSQEMLRQLNTMPESQKTALYKHLPLWIKDPDFERSQWFQTFLVEIYGAVHRQLKMDIVTNARAAFDQVVRQTSVLEGIDFDIDLGKVPFKLLGIKVSNANVDQVIMEMGISWPSDIKVQMAVRLRFRDYATSIPIKVSDVQFRAHLRLSFRPLSEVIPCFSGVSLSMMTKPHFDCRLHILSEKIDLMSIPGLAHLIKWCMNKYVFKPLLVYPKEMYVPMPWMEPPRDPLGLLEIRLRDGRMLRGAKAADQNVDPYVILWLDKDDHCRSSTLRASSNPQWDEEKVLLLDNPDYRLQCFVYDDEFGQGLLVQKQSKKKKGRKGKGEEGEVNASGDPLLAKFSYPQDTNLSLKDSPIMKFPHHWDLVTLREEESGAELALEVRFIPVLSREKAQEAQKNLRRNLFQRGDIGYEEKGVLAVDLIRAERLSRANVQDGTVDPYVALRLLDRVPMDEGDEAGGGATKSRKAGHSRKHSGTGQSIVHRSKGGNAMLIRELYEQSTTLPYDENPMFNESFKFVNISPESQLIVEVWDVPMKKSQDEVICIGTCTIDVAEVVRNRSIQQEFVLNPPEDEKDASPDDVRGKVIIGLKWTSFQFEVPRGDKVVPSIDPAIAANASFTQSRRSGVLSNGNGGLGSTLKAQTVAERAGRTLLE